MSKKSKEEKPITKEDIREVMEALMNEAMNSLMASDQFSDEQRGQIKEWLKRLYQLGEEHGKAMAIIDRLPDGALEKIQGFAKRVTEALTSEGGNKQSIEANFYKLLYQQEQQISESFKHKAFLLQKRIDGTFDKPILGCCFG